MGSGASKERFTLPVEHVPYKGKLLQYSFMSTNVTMKAHFWRKHREGQAVVTNNVEECYPQLLQDYKEGFKLELFLRIPFAISKGGMFSPPAKIPYQAVYSKKNATEPHTTSWKLEIESSTVNLHGLNAGLLFSLSQRYISTSADLSHVYEIFQRNAAVGGRFICMEETGMVVDARVSPGKYCRPKYQMFFF